MRNNNILTNKCIFVFQSAKGIFMKTKLGYIIGALFFLSACSPEEEKLLEINISVSVNEITAHSEGGSYKIEVSSNVDWTMDINYDDFSWCSVEGDCWVSDTVYIEVARSNSEAIKETFIVVRNRDVVNDYIVSDTIFVTQTGWSVPEEGVLINGTIWAKSNIDAFGTFAESPYHVGKLYQYNSPVAYTTTIYDEQNDYRNPVPAWTATPFSDTWMAENNPCPAGWRMPTSMELYALTKSGYTYNEALKGYFFGQNSESATKEDAKGCIFLSLGGKIADGEVFGMFAEGYYWAQDGHTLDENGYIRCPYLAFQNDNNSVKFTIATTPVKNAFSIRCVKE